MKKQSSFFLFCLFFITVPAMFSQNTAISGIINTYTKVTAIDTVCTVNLTVASAAGFHAGDTVLIIQMKGATIDITNTAAFGTIQNYNGAGNYEFTVIKSIAGNVISLKYNLLKPYTPAALVQLISVPSYVNATVTADLKAQVWNGTTGGILVFQASGTLTLNANIIADSTGFKGGAQNVNSADGTTGRTNFYYSSATNDAGFKGEGISILPLGYEAGRGANANGGGGGNGNGGGGGGGGNFGQGGLGGGQAYLAVIANGGIGGTNPVYSNAQNKIFPGAGGGGGFQNNSLATAGARGGGIIIIRANTIIGNGKLISSKGNTAINVSFNDGGGGGGAGGTILLDVPVFTGSLNINTNAGNGSNVFTAGDGGGGGGAGGALWISGASLPGNITYTATAGLRGINNGTGGANYNGSADGQPGGMIGGLQIPQGSVQPVYPVVTITGDTVICMGENTTLTASGATSYQWNPGTNPSITVNPIINTPYTVIGSNGTCSDTASVNVTVNPLPKAAFTFSTDGCSNVQFQNASTGALTYLWDFNDGSTSGSISPEHKYSVTGTYTVKLTARSPEGCMDSTSLKIDAKSSTSSFFVPNTFTPNDDALNDVFKVGNTGIGEFNAKIFNRWGELIYQWNDPLQGWDGKFKGKMVPEGVYVFIIKASDLCGSASYEKTGALTVLR